MDNSLNSLLALLKNVLYYWFRTSLHFFPIVLCKYYYKCQGLGLEFL